MAKQNKSRKLFATTATAALVASAIVPVASAASVNDFNQVPTWAQEAVQYLIDNGSVQGDNNGNFKPFSNLSRAQAAEVLSKELKLEATGTENFADVAENNWFYNAVLATSPEIFQGDDKGNFNPNKNLTRQEAAVVIVKAFGLTGSTSLNGFADASKVPGWAKAQFETAVANGVINGKGALLAPQDTITNAEFATMIFRAVEASSSAAVESVTAINATTVEVNFKEDIEDIKALDFAIEGLTVSNAVVKQTDKSVAVLTTSAQEGGKEYTVTLAGQKLGKFTGVSAVIPTGITTVEGSLQGVHGKEVTLKAQVTVAEGQSKAGIPVTFNITDTVNNNKNDKIEVEAFTNEEGVATYSYTRYYNGTDDVVAYATDKSSVKSSAKVYWSSALQLTVKADEENLKLANGDSVSYDIKGAADTVVFVAFKENQGVDPEKVSSKVKIVDTDDDTEIAIYDQDEEAELTDSKDFYPYYVDGKDYRIAAILLDGNGKGSFTLTGSDASVTPIVYTFSEKQTKKADFDVTDYEGDYYSRTALQATGETVTFEAGKSLQVEVEALGDQNAAALGRTLADGEVVNAGKTPNLGGRDYVATIKDKDGDLVGAGFDVAVVFEDGNFDEDENVYLIDADGKVHAVKADEAIELEADKDGKVYFTVVGESTGYAIPTVFIDQDEKGDLDSKEPQAAGAKVYFKSPKIDAAALKVVDGENDEVSSASAGDTVTYRYVSVAQNGKPYYDTTDEFVTTFSVEAKTTDVTVDDTTVKAGVTKTFTKNSVNGVAEIKVKGATKGSVTVKASSTSPKLTTVTKTVKFVGADEVGNVYTGYVVNVDKDEKTIEFDGKDPVEYSTSDTYIGEDGRTTTRVKFLDVIEKELAAGSKVKVKYEEGEKANTWTIVDIVEATSPAADTTAPTLVSAQQIDSTNIKLTFSEAVTGLVAANYTVVDATNATVATGSTVTGSGKEWTITTGGAIPASATTVEYFGTTTVDTATTPNLLANGSRVAIAQLASFTVTNGTQSAGTAAVKGVYTYTVGGTLPTATTDIVTLTDDNAGTTTVAVTFPSATPSATEVATAIATAINADAASKYVASTDGVRLTLTQKTASTADADTLASLALTTASSTSFTTFAGTSVTPVAGVDASQAFTIKGNATGGAITKNVTITIDGVDYSKSINFAAADTTATLVAQRIAGAFTADGSLNSYTFAEVSGELVVSGVAPINGGIQLEIK